MKKKAVLLTGFEPFGGQDTNASQLAVEAVDGRKVPGARLIRAELPCAFGAALDALRSQLREHRPDLVICVGQAGGRRGITPERVAINIDDARIPDNAGAQPVDQPIARSGPAAYWSTLPVKAIVAALRDEGLPAAVSDSAGTFVCNHVFYGLMRALRRRPGVRGGFVHLPFLDAQAAQIEGGAPSLSLAQLARGLEITIATALRAERDLPASTGYPAPRSAARRQPTYARRIAVP